jgi:amidase
VSANLCAAAIGTETDGSIVSPSTLCGIVGLKPTVGLVSRAGIIPISKTQDTAGPMTRTVRDAAILLTALAGVDPRDGATEASASHLEKDYCKYLIPDGLRGARLGVARRYFRSGGRGTNVMESALQILRDQGATLVEPIDDAALGKLSPHEGEVMLYEFKEGINAYLASLGDKAPVKNLTELINFNDQHQEQELKYFGQELFVRAEKKGPLTEKAYVEALQNCRRYSRVEGIDAIMDKHNLDAIIAPTGGPAVKTDFVYGDRGTGGSSSAAAVAGYPNITVPAGDVLGLPIGISFFGRAWSEPTLLRLAYAFEQATRFRTAPKFLTTVG